MTVRVNIGSNPYGMPIHIADSNSWIMRATTEGKIEFNYKDYPNFSEDDFAVRVLDILKTQWVPAAGQRDVLYNSLSLILEILNKSEVNYHISDGVRLIFARELIECRRHSKVSVS